MSATDPIAGALFGSDGLGRALALGVPAFVRRAKAVEDAIAALRSSLASERSARLAALLPAARRVAAACRREAELPAAARAILDVLHRETGLLARAGPARARAVAALARGVRTFNGRWVRHLETVPIERVRELQRNYNRYYPIEREAATPGRQPRFAELPLLDRAQLFAWFPPLPELCGERPSS